MKVLVSGKGNAAPGSWNIRAVQLGGAVGATVVPRTEDVEGYDVVVIVKRHSPALPATCRRVGVPFVWDVVDAWVQPEGNGWDERRAKEWLRGELEAMRPALVLGATERMGEDIRAMGFPSVCIPHHSRPGILPQRIREQVSVVGYEGSPAQLGEWGVIVAAECRRRGWTFMPDGSRFREFDIVVALREATGYAPRHWKSGVKLANAQAAGIPFVGSPECGYLELRVPGVEHFVESEAQLRAAFDALAPFEVRRRKGEWMRAAAAALTLDNVAGKYRAALEWACATRR